jgi:phage-related tail protein
MSLIEIKDNLDNAEGSLESALSGITEGLRDEDTEAYFKSYPDLKVMSDKLDAMRRELKTLWTPKLLEYLKEEEKQQSEMEDQADAMSY